MQRDEGYTLTDNELSLINGIIDAPIAWQTPDELAEATGLGIVETLACLCDLMLAGWVDHWFRDGEAHPHVTLSALGAVRLGVRLEERGPGEVLVWSHESASIRSRRRPGRAARARTEANAELLGQAPDRQPTPAALAEALDELQLQLQDRARRKHRARRIEELPNPTVLVGMADPAYLPKDDFARRNPRMGSCGVSYPQNLQKERACKGCGGRDLKPSWVCPRCSRWGLDGLASALGRAEARAAG